MEAYNMTSEEKYPLFQKLMDDAYDRWNHGDLQGLMLSYDRFIESLDDFSAKMVVLGNLNYQVENGGFLQWFDNGYVSQKFLLRRTLADIGTESAKKAIDLIDDATDVLDQMLTDEENDYSDELDKLDAAYFAISEQLMADAEIYIILKSVKEGR